MALTIRSDDAAAVLGRAQPLQPTTPITFLPSPSFNLSLSGAATHPQNANVGLFIVGIEPPEWKEAVLKDWWYRLSCLTLIPPGIFTVMYPETYEPFNPWFPWR